MRRLYETMTRSLKKEAVGLQVKKFYVINYYEISI